MCERIARSQPHREPKLARGADGAIWSPDGQNIVFVSAVYPDCKNDACNKQRDDELKNSKVKAKIFTRLFYRHWNAFTEFKRSHLFVTASQGGVAKDLTPGNHDVPPFNLGGQDFYAVSPDGKEIAAGCADGIVRIWEVATGRHLATLFTFPARQQGQAVDESGVAAQEGRRDFAAPGDGDEEQGKLSR